MKPISVKNAVRGIQYKLKSDFGSHYFSVDVHRGLHFLLRPVDNKDLFNYYVLFKDTFFWDFHKYFPEFIKANPDEAVVGESINIEALRFALKHDVKILLFAHREDSKIYYISSKLLWRRCEEHNLFRTQDKWNKTSKWKMVETTASFPISWLNRWGDL